jgi:uncharacterized protein YuzE
MKKMTDKDREKFAQELKVNRKKFTKLLNPRLFYTKDYDIFYICWGDKKIESTIETDMGIRFDITKDGTIVGIEIEDLMSKLKKFDCD